MRKFAKNIAASDRKKDGMARSPRNPVKVKKSRNNWASENSLKVFILYLCEKCKRNLCFDRSD